MRRWRSSSASTCRRQDGAGLVLSMSMWIENFVFYRMMPGIANVVLLRSRKSSSSFMEGSSPGGNPCSASKHANNAPSPSPSLPPSPSTLSVDLHSVVWDF